MAFCGQMLPKRPPSKQRKRKASGKVIYERCIFHLVDERQPRCRRVATWQVYPEKLPQKAWPLCDEHVSVIEADLRRDGRKVRTEEG